MKKRTRVLSMALAGLLAISMTACSSGTSGSGGEGGEAASGEVVTIKFSLSHAATEPAVQAANEFAEEMAEKSGGTLKVEVYPDNQLGSERDVIEGLQLHTVEMADPANAVLSNFIDSMNLFELPMLFENKQHVYAVLDDIGMQFADECEAQGFKLLGWFDMGSRHIMTVNKPINSLADIQGLKIRVQESPANMAGMGCFGAAPTPMSYNELYTSLESGVLDGAEAAATNYYQKAFWEVAPNWAKVNWFECVNPVLMDLQFYNNLSDEHKQILEECVANMIPRERQLYAESEVYYEELLKEEGINITVPDRQEWQDCCHVAYEEFADRVGGMEAIEAVINYDYSSYEMPEGIGPDGVPVEGAEAAAPAEDAAAEEAPAEDAAAEEAPAEDAAAEEAAAEEAPAEDAAAEEAPADDAAAEEAPAEEAAEEAPAEEAAE